MPESTFDIVVNQAFWEHFFLIKDEPESDPDREDYKQDFWRFLRKSRRFARFIGDFGSWEAFSSAIAENPVLEALFNHGPSFFDPSAHTGSFVADTPLLHSGNPFKLFCLEEEPEETKELLTKSGWVLIQAGSIQETWQNYSQLREDRTLVVSLQDDSYPEAYFTQWDQLQAYAHPFHSLLIWDPYIFTGKLEKNLKPMLRELTQTCQEGQALEILIITREMERDGDKHISPSILAEELQRYVRKKSKTQASVHILPLIKGEMKQANAGERNIDRWLLTNNLFVDGGHGFNIFNDEGKISRSSKLEFTFALSSFIQPHIQHLLRMARRYVKTHTGKAPNNPLLQE